MKMTFNFFFLLILCLSLSVPAAAQELKASGQQILIEKLRSGSAIQTRLYEKSSGMVEIEVTRLDGIISMMSSELAAIKGSKLNASYRLNSPDNQAGLNCLVDLNGKTYQGDIYLSGSKIIFSRDLIQLISKMSPGAGDLESLPDYLYNSDPKMSYLWKAMLNSKGWQMLPEMDELLAFFIEAIPDSCVYVSGGNVVLSLNQQTLSEMLFSFVQKIEREPDRFASSLPNYLKAVYTGKLPGDDFPGKLHAGGESGVLPKSAQEIELSLKNSGIELVEFVLITPRDIDGASTLKASLNVYDKSNYLGSIALSLTQERKGDRIEGHSAFTVKLISRGYDSLLMLDGDYVQSPASASADYLCSVRVAQNDMSLLSAGIKITSRVEADSDVRVGVPVLTEANSREFKN